MPGVASKCKWPLLVSMLAGSLMTPLSLKADSTILANIEADATEHHAPLDAVSSQRSPAGNWIARQSLYYKRNWGVDIVGVRPVSSGQMLAFRFRVLDTDRAKPLFDKTAKPYLIDAATGTRLAVPAMENVGELRQSSLREDDRNYFMIFGNPGKLVKSGSRVSVVIGNFRIDDLVVD